MFRFILMLAISGFLGGCGVTGGIAGKMLPGPLGGGSADSEVKLLSVKPGGKALLLVSPDFLSAECTQAVEADGKPTKINCRSAYLVSCDASRSANGPFCTLVEEKSHSRASAYPASRR